METRVEGEICVERMNISIREELEWTLPNL
jgi:hypothetical protein